MDTEEGVSPVPPEGAGRRGISSHHLVRDLKVIFELLSSGILHLIFSDHSGLWITETAEQNHRIRRCCCVGCFQTVRGPGRGTGPAGESGR